VVMPGMMRVMFDSKEEKIRRFALNVYHIHREEFDLDIVIKKTEDFFRLLGVKTKLSEYGITQNEIPGIISNLSKGNEIKLGENGLVNAQKVQQILECQL